VLIALDSSGDPYSPLHAASALYREQKWGDQVCGQKTESSHRLSPGSRIDITDHTKERSVISAQIRGCSNTTSKRSTPSSPRPPAPRNTGSTTAATTQHSPTGSTPTLHATPKLPTTTSTQMPALGFSCTLMPKIPSLNAMSSTVASEKVDSFSAAKHRTLPLTILSPTTYSPRTELTESHRGGAARSGRPISRSQTAFGETRTEPSTRTESGTDRRGTSPPILCSSPRRGTTTGSVGGVDAG